MEAEAITMNEPWRPGSSLANGTYYTVIALVVSRAALSFYSGCGTVPCMCHSMSESQRCWLVSCDQHCHVLRCFCRIFVLGISILSRCFETIGFYIIYFAFSFLFVVCFRPTSYRHRRPIFINAASDVTSRN